jgi:hypothetical protein
VSLDNLDTALRPDQTKDADEAGDALEDVAGRITDQLEFPLPSIDDGAFGPSNAP